MFVAEKLLKRAFSFGTTRALVGRVLAHDPHDSAFIGLSRRAWRIAYYLFTFPLIICQHVLGIPKAYNPLQSFKLSLVYNPSVGFGFPEALILQIPSENFQIFYDNRWSQSIGNGSTSIIKNIFKRQRLSFAVPLPPSI